MQQRAAENEKDANRQTKQTENNNREQSINRKNRNEVALKGKYHQTK